MPIEVGGGGVPGPLGDEQRVRVVGVEDAAQLVRRVLGDARTEPASGSGDERGALGTIPGQDAGVVELRFELSEDRAVMLLDQTADLGEVDAAVLGVLERACDTSAQLRVGAALLARQAVVLGGQLVVVGADVLDRRLDDRLRDRRDRMPSTPRLPLQLTRPGRDLLAVRVRETVLDALVHIDRAADLAVGHPIRIQPRRLLAQVRGRLLVAARAQAAGRRTRLRRRLVRTLVQLRDTTTAVLLHADLHRLHERVAVVAALHLQGRVRDRRRGALSRCPSHPGAATDRAGAHRRAPDRTGDHQRRVQRMVLQHPAGVLEQLAVA